MVAHSLLEHVAGCRLQQTPVRQPAHPLTLPNIRAAIASSPAISGAPVERS
jgi:hypothetical protein